MCVRDAALDLLHIAASQGPLDIRHLVGSQVRKILRDGQKRSSDGNARCRTAVDVTGKKSRFLTPPLLKRKEKESLSLLIQRAAKRKAILCTRIWSLFVRVVIDDRCKGITCLYALMTNKTKDIAVKITC